MEQMVSNYMNFLNNARMKVMTEYHYGRYSADVACRNLIGMGVAELIKYEFPIASPDFLKKEQALYKYVKNYRSERTFNEGILNISRGLLAIVEDSCKK